MEKESDNIMTKQAQLRALNQHNKMARVALDQCFWCAKDSIEQNHKDRVYSVAQLRALTDKLCHKRLSELVATEKNVVVSPTRLTFLIAETVKYVVANVSIDHVAYATASKE